VREVAQVAAAVLLGDGHAVQAEVAKLLPQVGGEEVLLVDRLRTWRDLLRGEVTDGGAQETVRLAQGELESGEVGHDGHRD
jgi:hypothetical protein